MCRFPPYPCAAQQEEYRPADADNYRVPNYFMGRNPYLTEVAVKYKMPLEGVRGGAETMYPEWRAKIMAKAPAQQFTLKPVYNDESTQFAERATPADARPDLRQSRSAARRRAISICSPARARISRFRWAATASLHGGFGRGTGRVIRSWPRSKKSTRSALARRTGRIRPPVRRCLAGDARVPADHYPHDHQYQRRPGSRRRQRENPRFQHFPSASGS